MTVFPFVDVVVGDVLVTSDDIIPKLVFEGGDPHLFCPICYSDVIALLLLLHSIDDADTLAHSPWVRYCCYSQYNAGGDVAKILLLLTIR